MLGIKMGTGGSSGYYYLKATVAKHRAFVDLFNLSTCLIPRAVLPDLPPQVRRMTSFSFSVSNEMPSMVPPTPP